MVSLRTGVGMVGSFSSPAGLILGNVGRVATRFMSGFSPFFLASLDSARRRLASCLARALLTVLVTIFIRALVTLRSQ